MSLSSAKGSTWAARACWPVSACGDSMRVLRASACRHSPCTPMAAATHRDCLACCGKARCMRNTAKRWDLAFDNVRGRATYGSGGFEADKLAVVRGGKPGRLSLRAGAYTHDHNQAFEADLDASLSADDLVSRAPALDWLKPYLDGSSTWTIGVAIPRAATASGPALPSHLQLRSNLVGTAITLPAPLRKVAAVELPAFIDAALPMG